MNGRDWHAIAKIVMAVTLAAILWYQVTLLRKARSDDREAGTSAPLWVFDILVRGDGVPVEFREHIFMTRAGCTEGAIPAGRAPKPMAVREGREGSRNTETDEAMC